HWINVTKSAVKLNDLKREKLLRDLLRYDITQRYFQNVLARCEFVAQRDRTAYSRDRCGVREIELVQIALCYGLVVLNYVRLILKMKSSAAVGPRVIHLKAISQHCVWNKLTQYRVIKQR